MRLMFSNPNNLRATGIFFLQSLLHKRFHSYDERKLKKEIVFRFFKRGEQKKAIFLPLNLNVFFARKGDIVILPDDSIRSISSVAKLRFKRKEYGKYFFQLMRLALTHLLLSIKTRQIYLTVSLDDLHSLRERYPRIQVDYIPHPIQASVNMDSVCDLSKTVDVVCFMNLQEHYSLKPDDFFSKTNEKNISFSKLKTVYFHGSYSKHWCEVFQEKYPEVHSSAVNFVDDFEGFFKSIDLIVLPLAAGAGVKNIVLNSLYRKKIVVGTLEAFSGMPNKLIKRQVIRNIDDLALLVNSNEALARTAASQNDLSSYIVSHHTEDAFFRVLQQFAN